MPGMHARGGPSKAVRVKCQHFIHQLGYIRMQWNVGRACESLFLCFTAELSGLFCQHLPGNEETDEESVGHMRLRRASLHAEGPTKPYAIVRL